MDIVNKSRKIIGINGEPLLPGATMKLEDGAESHPVIAEYLAKGIVVDVKKDRTIAMADSDISDFERAKIAEEAIAQYKKQQEDAAASAAMAAKEAEIKAVQNMKKPELLMKAAGMGLEVKDDDKVEDLKDKIIAAINQ